MSQAQRIVAQKPDTPRASREVKPTHSESVREHSTPAPVSGLARRPMLDRPFLADGPGRNSGLSRILQLQQSMGNQAVLRLLRTAGMQPKLRIGAVTTPWSTRPTVWLTT
jgi:hypothetical protein